MSYRFIRIFIAIIFLSLQIACQYNPPTTHDYDVNYNFSNLKSYSWLEKKKLSSNKEIDVEEGNSNEIVTLDDKRQRKAIDVVLESKGFFKSKTPQEAQFLIRSHNVSDKKKDVSTFYSIWGYYPLYRPYIWPQHVSNSVEREYEVGTLIVDIVDNQTKEVIWQGSISRRMGFYKHQTPEQRDEKAVRSAKLMLKSFPPTGGK